MSEQESGSDSGSEGGDGQGVGGGQAGDGSEEPSAWNTGGTKGFRWTRLPGALSCAVESRGHAGHKQQPRRQVGLEAV